MELRKYLSVFRNTQEEKKRKKKRFSSYSGVEEAEAEAEEEEEEEEEDLLVGDAYRRLYCAGRRLFLMVFLRFSPRCFNSWTLTTQLSHNPLKDLLLLLLLLLTAQRKYKAERWKPTTTTTKTHEHNHNHNHNNQSINESKINQHDFRKNHFFPIAGGFSD